MGKSAILDLTNEPANREIYKSVFRLGGILMNWLRVILDGLAVSLIFNVATALFFFIMPHAYAHMMPKEIKKAAEPYTKKELRSLELVIYSLFFGVVLWMIISAHNAGIRELWNLFWTAYIEMLFVNFGDFLILDCWLMAVIRSNGRIAGTESCKAWEVKEYMKQAVPEHFLAWPLGICTAVGFVCAGIGVWLA